MTCTAYGQKLIAHAECDNDDATKPAIGVLKWHVAAVTDRAGPRLPA